MSVLIVKKSSESESFVGRGAYKDNRGAKSLFWLGAHRSVPGGPPGQSDPGTLTHIYPERDRYTERNTYSYRHIHAHNCYSDRKKSHRHTQSIRQTLLRRILVFSRTAFI